MHAMRRFNRLSFSACFEGKPLTQGEFVCLASLRARGDADLPEAARRMGKELPPEAGACVWELAEEMRVRPPAVSRMLRGLEQWGLIRREVDSADRRNIRVTLTPVGEGALRAMKADMDRFTGAVAARMGPEEMARLVELLGRLCHAVEEELGEMKRC